MPGVIARVWMMSNFVSKTHSELQSSTRNLQFGGTLDEQFNYIDV